MASIKYKTEDGYVSIPMSIEAKTNEENGNGIGTCSTSSGTALTVSLTGYELVQNGFVAVTFENDVPANATLNINGKGAKPIIYKGSAIEADVIKADDTVMFCYNGSQYVVTSLGGGGGSVVVPTEYAVIHLTSNEGDGDENLIGATITVTDDDTSDVIGSTTWSGSDYILPIDRGVNYTVTVGNVTDYIINTNSQSYTAIGYNSRNISFLYIGGFVDLGLPSGVLWSTKDLGADTPEGTGLVFSYGNIQGHDINSSYSFNDTNYSSTHGASLGNNVSYTSGDPEFDAAAYHTNGIARVPTITEWRELVDNTDKSVVTINNKLCGKFANKNNPLLYIILPGNGAKYDERIGYAGRYIGASSTAGDNAQQDTNFILQSPAWYLGTDGRAVGVFIRPVI